ncbi:damage-inducible protein DinB [Deinococcus sp. SDU3-2]|uniref:Damage-inducible protein DinB n=1 Tax=Deinococcus terrestris TaxID=2651870 RepID=A0A7X1TR44_9DEIO|nr:DinB family protein [Deinococcus terrestris]MPY65922.1 damage-inducible protein DinB [Deinococcus terrestris]
MNLLQGALGGTSFPDPERLLADLSWQDASRPVPGVPYTLAEVLAHLAGTARASLDLAAGRAEEWPGDLDLWPGVRDEAHFRTLLTELRLGLTEARALADSPSDRARDILTDLAAHSAYHWGQVALLRRVLGVWPESE